MRVSYDEMRNLFHNELNKKHMQCYSICEDRFKDSPLSEYEVKCCKSSCRIYKYQALANFWDGEKSHHYDAKKIEMCESQRIENLKKLREEKIKYKVFVDELKQKKREYNRFNSWFRRGKMFNGSGSSFSVRRNLINQRCRYDLEDCYSERLRSIKQDSVL